MNSPPDPFEFLKNLWGPMGLPLAGLTAPTAAINEVDRRIAELKSVEMWLNTNLNVLRMSIQALEMQKAGLVAMQNAASPAPNAAAQPPSGGDDPAKK
ncbi:MAG TPA: PhaM family polyhydroxyalkanoate granule multifunctional regulatory protein [Burkholderiales bacterium]|nr:PhaM family polyhydroxyalkanoate granule multifunctional regulatory protein [Burkholderiales bacterium]